MGGLGASEVIRQPASPHWQAWGLGGSNLGRSFGERRIASFHRGGRQCAGQCVGKGRGSGEGMARTLKYLATLDSWQRVDRLDKGLWESERVAHRVMRSELRVCTRGKVG